MKDRLSAGELVDMVRRVFAPTKADRALAFIVDMPDNLVPDTNTWRERREMVAEWASLLAPRASQLGLEEVRLVLYVNPHANNANLPPQQPRQQNQSNAKQRRNKASNRITIA